MKKLVISVFALLNTYIVLFVGLSNVLINDGAIIFLLEEVPFVGIIASMLDTIAEMKVSVSAISTSAFYEDLFKTLLILIYFKINWMIINVFISMFAKDQKKAEDKAFYKINMLWKCPLLIVITAIVSKYADIVLEFFYTYLGTVGTYVAMFAISAVVVSLSAVLTKACDKKISIKISFTVVLINQVLKSILDGFATVVFCALIYISNNRGYISSSILAIFGYVVVIALIEDVCRRLLLASV